MDKRNPHEAIYTRDKLDEVDERSCTTGALQHQEQSLRATIGNDSLWPGIVDRQR